MTVSAQNSYIVYTGNGSTTAYSWPYKLFASGDLKVYTMVIATGVETLQTSGGGGTYDYTINADLDTVTLTTNLPVTHKLFLTRVQDIEQPTDYIEGDAFPAAVHEDTLDKIVLQLQQHEEQLKRALKFKQTTATRSEPAIPELAADKLIKMNAAGDGFETQSTADVATVAGLSSEIAALDAIAANITTVAGIAANVTSVAGDATDIGAVAAKATEIGRLGTVAAVADLAILGTSAIVTDLDILATSANVTAMGLLGTSAVVTDMGLLGTSAVVTDMDLLATSANVTAMGLLGNSSVIANMALLGTSDAISDMNTLATSDIVSDLNTLATSDIVSDLNQLATSDFVSDLNAIEAVKANVTTCADNLTGINNFAALYRQGSTNPTGSLDAGDLFFNTSDNTLKYYNGSSWASITAGIGSLADDTTPQLGGDLDLNGNIIDFKPEEPVSNANTVGANTTTTLTTARNYILYGPITVSSSYTWTVGGSGELRIL